MDLIIGLIIIGISIGSIISMLFTWKENIEKQKVWVPTKSYAQVVRETIFFTGSILHNKGIKHYPSYKIYYHSHKKYLGYYKNSAIYIYVGCNKDIPQLVSTVLHEICHAIQDKTDKNFKRYDWYTTNWTYYNNPFEDEARRFEMQNIEACIKHLATKGIIIHK